MPSSNQRASGLKDSNTKPCQREEPEEENEKKCPEMCEEHPVRVIPWKPRVKKMSSRGGWGGSIP